MNKKKFQIVFVLMMVMMLVFGNVHVADAAQTDPSAPFVTGEVVKGSRSFAYSWANVPIDEGYMISMDGRSPYLVTVSSYSGTEIGGFVFSIPRPNGTFKFIYSIELIDPSGNIISSATDYYLDKNEYK